MAGRLERGEIRLYSFPAPDKERPVLILTRSSAISYLSRVTVAPITSTQRAHGDELGLLRGQLTNLRALLVLSILMTESADDEQILRLAASSAVSLGGWRIAGFATSDRPSPPA